jgi:hypothetical protein
MQSSLNDIPMFCSIQTHRHIGTSNMKFYIKRFMHSSCNDNNISIRVHLCITSHINHHIQSSRNDIPMLCSIQTLIHIAISSHENHHKTCHTTSS